ncbi:glycosyltransferase [Patescibacteria group bacterium]|nr:MAG: glycosyltransferase [Patescibacteria group bacterium]
MRESMVDRNTETIDVVIPVYNGEKYIIQAITSVERQTYLPKKIIVVDDGSTDKTNHFIHHFHGKIPLEYIQKKNEGPNSARNAGIQKCTSQFIAFLDADDEWYADKLERQVKIFQISRFKNLGVVYCAYSIIDEKGDLINDQFIIHNPSARGHVFKQILPLNTITGSASGVLIKNECFERVGMFDETLRIGEDWDMWLRIAKEYEFDYVNKALVKIRRHDRNAQNNESFVFRNKLMFYNKWATSLPDDIDVPPYWIKSLINLIFNRLPKTDFIKLFRSSISSEVKKKFLHTISHELKWYICVKIAILPFILISKIIYFPFKKTCQKNKISAKR